MLKRHYKLSLPVVIIIIILSLLIFLNFFFFPFIILLLISKHRQDEDYLIIIIVINDKIIEEELLKDKIQSPTKNQPNFFLFTINYCAKGNVFFFFHYLFIFFSNLSRVSFN